MKKIERENFETELGRELFDRISQISDDQEFLSNVFVFMKQEYRKEKMKMLLDAGLSEPGLIELFTIVIASEIVFDDELFRLLDKNKEELGDYILYEIGPRRRARWRAWREREEREALEREYDSKNS